MTNRLILTVAVLGGTGHIGAALAQRWARAGYYVILGSRQQSKAQQVADELNARLGRPAIRGMTNEAAAASCDIAVLTVPYAAHASTLEAVKDRLSARLLVDVTVPIDSKRNSVASRPAAGSAAQEAQAILGARANVAAAFHNVSYEHVRDDEAVPCDILVCADGDEARAQTLQLVAAAGMVGWDAGALANAAVVEGLTAILIGINRRYKIRGAGIRITGVPADAASP
jgi:NADPH-dependent F420 reductase